MNPKVILTRIQTEESLLSNADINANVDLFVPRVSHVVNYSPKDPLAAWPTVQIARGIDLSRSFFDTAPPPLPVNDAPHSGWLLPVKKYSLADPATDQNFRLTVGSVSMPASFFVHTRSAYALFKYTTQVNNLIGNLGGGLELFLNLWGQKYKFDQ